MAFDDPFNANNVPTDGVEGNNFYNFSEEDPAAEFLEREKRELGDIAGDEPSKSGSASNNTLTNGMDPSPSLQAPSNRLLFSRDTFAESIESWFSIPSLVAARRANEWARENT